MILSIRDDLILSLIPHRFNSNLPIHRSYPFTSQRTSSKPLNWKSVSSQDIWISPLLPNLTRQRLAQIVNAIHCAFKSGYFPGIYTLTNPYILTVIIRVITNTMLWMNHVHILLSNDICVYGITMTTVGMVTMATMEISIFWPQNLTFGPGAMASQ